MFNPEELAYHEPNKQKRKKLRLPHLKFPSLPSVSAKRKKKNIFFGAVLVLFGLGLIAWSQYLNLQKQFQPKPDEVTNTTPPQQVLGLIEKVENKGAILPKNEFPTVATVSDLASLSDQAFFNGAAIGDKVLIYAGAKKAVLYRPSSDKIIRESRVEMADTAQTPQSSESAVLAASDSGEPVLRIKY